MENTLKKLLTNDKYLIVEGTKELQQYLTRPDCIANLCSILESSEDVELRQYSAVILRKRFASASNWHRLNKETAANIRTGLIQRLIAEPEKTVKNCVVQLISTVLKHEDDATGWPELVQFLQQSMTSINMDLRELGFYTLSILLELSSTEFISYAPQFVCLFEATLNQLEDKACPVGFYVVVCMVHLGANVKDNKEIMNKYTEMIPKVIEIIQASSTKRSDRALEALDFFYDFCEKDCVSMLLPRIKEIVAFFLTIIPVQGYTEDLRIKCLSIISALARVKVKALAKNGLILPILHIVFQIMCSKPEDDENEEYFTSDPDEDTLLTCACDVLDTIALVIDAKKLIKPVMDFVKPALENPDPYTVKGGYLAIGIVSQGCESYIRSKCLEQFVKCVQNGVVNTHPVVRGASLFSLGQLAEHLQPEVSVYSAELMPILINLLTELRQTTNTGENPGGNRTDRLFFAIERFAENMESSLVPYLSELFTQLLPLCGEPFHKHIRELSMGAIGVIAGAVKQDIVPYFSDIMNYLNIYLLNKAEGEDVSLQVEALDTLAMLARNVGYENFEPIALETVKLGLTLVSGSNEPDIRKSSYRLFAAVSHVMKSTLAPMLSNIVEPIIKSLQDENIPPSKNDDSGFPVIDYSGDNDDDDEEDLDSDDEFSVENDFAEEKEEACFALSELATNSGEAFVPYLQTSFEVVFKLLDSPNSDVRQAALEAEFRFCISFAKLTLNAENQDDINLIQVTRTLVTKAAQIAQSDDDSDVVLAALEGFQNILKEIGSRLASSQQIKEQIVRTINDVINLKTEVQSWSDSDPSDGLDDNDELFEMASYVIPALSNIMSAPEFILLFAQFLPLLMKRVVECDEDDDDNNEDNKASTLGVLAECMPALGPAVGDHLNGILPFILSCAEDENIDVRNNALYTLGEMAYHGKNVVIPHYGVILAVLSKTLSCEKRCKVMDNACAVIAKLILVNASGLPLRQILPALVGQLPLKEDFEEDKWIYRSVCHLLQLDTNCLRPHAGDIFSAALVSLNSHQPDNETKEILTGTLQMINSIFPDIVSAVIGVLSPDILAILKSV